MITQARVGRFEIRDFLGRGAVGDVYSAWDPHRGEEVALKLIRLRGTDPDMLEAERHGLALQQVLARSAQQVAAVYEFGEDDNYFGASLEYVSGNDLSGILQESLLLERTAIEIALQLCQFLELSHNFTAESLGRSRLGIIHGDIKPENIKIQADGRVRLLDFGTAKHLTVTRRFTHHLFGSLPYTPPERLANGVLDRGSDLWAVGVVIHLMLSGESPFPGDDPEQIEAWIRSGSPPKPPPETVSPSLARVIRKTLAFDPALRYSSAAALATDLKACLEGREPSVDAIGLMALEETAAAQVSPPRLPRLAGQFPRDRKNSKAPRIIPSLRQLDVLPPSAALGSGAAVGGIAAILLINFAPLPVMVSGFLLLLWLAGLMAWSGEPVLIEEPSPEEEAAENAGTPGSSTRRLLFPPSGAHAQIDYVDREGKKVFWMTKEEITIGRRDPDHRVDLPLAAPGEVSRIHLKIQRVPEKGEFVVFDYSELGTTINGRPLLLDESRKTYPTRLPNHAVIGLAGEIFLEFQKLDLR